MNLWPVNLYRLKAPAACFILLLILFLLPDTSLVEGGKGGVGGGKKKLMPVKHLFGVGIGYQRVVHYKPVLVFSKHRRNKKKKRRPGWGWGGGGGGGRGKQGWTPVVVQHHIYKDESHHAHSPHHRHGVGGGGWGGRGGGGGGGGDNHHHHHHHHSHAPKRRTKPRYRPHRHGGGLQSYRGWGWRPGTGPARRTPPESSRHPDDDHRHHRHHNRGSHDHHGGFGFHPPSSHHPPTSDDDYGGNAGVEWRPGTGLDQPGYTTYGSPGLDYVDGDDNGGYETEIKPHWNPQVGGRGPPLTPLTFPGATASEPGLQPSAEALSSPPEASPNPPPPPPLYPFEDAPKSDSSVTNIRRDFLKNHMKFFKEFQGYQEAHRNHNEHPGDNQMMKPPGPNYSTTDLQGPPPQYYDQDYYGPNDNGPGKSHNPSDNPQGPSLSDNYNYDVIDDDGFNWSELNRKMSATGSSTTPPPSPPAFSSLPLIQQAPSIIYGVQGALPSQQNNVVVNAPVQTNIQVNTTPQPPPLPIPMSMPNSNRKGFKPSQRIDLEDLGSGPSFNEPGFFPSFDQFQNIRME